MSDASPHVIDAHPETFQQDVVERSRQIPVVIDFWAAWCQPCRMLGPVLERLAAEYDGRFLLAKVDTEEMPDMAAAFGVSGIPAVFGLRDGKLVDSFTGVQSESAIRAFLDRLLPSPAEEALAAALESEASDPSRALDGYLAALELDPNLAPARIGLARVYLALNRAEDARAELDRLERTQGYLQPEAETVRAELTLHAGGRDAGDLETARHAFAADPKNRRLEFQLAEALAAQGHYAEALEHCLGLVERDRQNVGEEARKLMLAIFQLLPENSPLSADFRRQLSFVL